jgi:hypothetical protein
VKVDDVLVICSFRKESSDNGFGHFVNYSTSTLCSSRRLPLPISSVSRSLSLQSLFSSLDLIFHSRSLYYLCVSRLGEKNKRRGKKNKKRKRKNWK